MAETTGYKEGIPALGFLMVKESQKNELSIQSIITIWNLSEKREHSVIVNIEQGTLPEMAPEPMITVVNENPSSRC